MRDEQRQRIRDAKKRNRERRLEKVKRKWIIKAMCRTLYAEELNKTILNGCNNFTFKTADILTNQAKAAWMDAVGIIPGVVFTAKEKEIPSDPCEVVKKIREELNKHPKQAGGLIRFTYWGGTEKGGNSGEP